MTFRTIGRAALVSGTVASITSTLALVVMARVEGKGALRPTNATSHWLNGQGAAAVEQLDLDHTAVGYGTHHAATMFWALLFEAMIARYRPAAPKTLLASGLVVSGIAAAVDYGATPKRFTPGWEFVLSKGSMTVVYAAMGAGFVLGARAFGKRAADARR